MKKTLTLSQIFKKVSASKFKKTIMNCPFCGKFGRNINNIFICHNNKRCASFKDDCLKIDSDQIIFAYKGSMFIVSKNPNKLYLEDYENYLIFKEPLAIKGSMTIKDLIKLIDIHCLLC